MMAGIALEAVLGKLRRSLRRKDEVVLTDAELLDGILNRDEGAFEALLRRHGPMVFGVCRRVLRNEADAEDAFQATFLVLVKRAASIRQRNMVGNWLYGVAHTTALKAVAMRIRRLMHERKAAQRSITDKDTETWMQLQELLDQELKRLPDKCRAAIVFCDLEGKSIKEAACQLGCPPGTVGTRLARGRQLLSRRLRRHALYLSGGMIATLIAQKGAAAAVPCLLFASTMSAATITAAGQMAVSRAISAKVVALVDGVLKTMLFARLKLISVLLVLALLGGISGRLLCQQVSAEPPVADARTPVAQTPVAQTPVADAPGSPKTESEPKTLMRMGTQSWRHSSNVNYVAFLPDGKSIITADMQQTIRLWDRETGKEIHRFTRPAKEVSDVDTDIESNKEWLTMAGFGARNSGVAVAPDGKAVAAVYGQTIHLWDVGTGKHTGEIKGPASGNGVTSGIGSIMFAADSKTLAGRGRNRTTYLWEADTGKEIAKIKVDELGVAIPTGAAGAATAVVISPDGKNIAWAEWDDHEKGKLTTWLVIADRTTAKEVRRFKLDHNGSSAMAYSPDGKLLAFATSSGIHLCEADSDKELRLLKGHAGIIGSLVFSHDGKTLASRTAAGLDSQTAEDGNVTLWDVEKGKKLLEIKAELPPATVHGNVRCFAIGTMNAASHELAFSPDGKTLAVGEGHLLRFFSTQTGKEESKQAGLARPVTDVRVSLDGKTIVTKSRDDTIRRWDVSTGNELSSFEAPKGARCLAIAPDGRLIAFGNADNTVRLCDAATGKELHKLAAPDGGAAVVAFSGDGKTLAVRGDGKSSIALFDVALGKEIRTFSAPQTKPRFVGMAVIIGGGANIAPGPALVFSPDGSTLASFLPGSPAVKRQVVIPESPSVIELVHVGTGASRRIELPSDRIALNIAYSPDGRTLAVENADGTVTLVEVAGGQERCRIGVEEKLNTGETGSAKIGITGKSVVHDFMPFGMGGAAAAAKIAFSPDGRRIAVVRDDAVEIWDMDSTKCIKSFKGHDGSISALAFAPDGKSLVTGGSDTTLLVWDTSGLHSEKPAHEKLTDKQLEEAWANLEDSNSASAVKSMQNLVKAPEQASKWLKHNLSPAVPADNVQVEKWIGNLDSEDFEMRTKAIKELEKLGELAVPALEKTLSSGPPLEVKKRIEELIERVVGAFQTGSRLRMVRAIEVLEKINTPQAREVLETLAKGAAGALPTREAKAALERMGK